MIEDVDIQTKVWLLGIDEFISLSDKVESAETSKVTSNASTGRKPQ